MINRRQFASAVAALGFPFVARGATTPVLHLGLVSDPQYVDAEPWINRHYRASIPKLGAAIEHLNSNELDFCVNGGDCIDRDWVSFDPIMKVFAMSRHKFHHVLGNHDFELPDPSKKLAPGRIGMEKRYYTFAKKEFCFVFLDTNDVSVYAYAAGTPESDAAATELKRRAATGAIEAQPWNGAVGPAQLKWLDETCAAAKEAGQKVVLFGHHPILPSGNSHNLWNPSDLLLMMRKHRHIVAWFNGHNHAGGYAVAMGVPITTLCGMVETKDTNAFARLQLFTDRMVVTGHGREPSREVLFRT